jgi:hypothetical protein
MTIFHVLKYPARTLTVDEWDEVPYAIRCAYTAKKNASGTDDYLTHDEYLARFVRCFEEACMEYEDPV